MYKNSVRGVCVVMVYSKYGKTFRKIREQKKLSLSIFPEIGISKPALSKFERGETMMGFENVVRALQEMGVTLEEYENFLNAYTLGEEEALWEKIERAFYQEDVLELKELQKYAETCGFYFMSLAAKACYSNLSHQEAEEVTEYLYDIEIWSFTELRLFYFSMENLKPRDILHIFRMFFPDGHEIFNSKKYCQHVVQLCCRATTLFASLGYPKEAKTFLEQMKFHSLPKTMSQRNLVNITEGYWIHCFGDPVKGKKLIVDGLEVLRTTNSLDEFLYYQRHYSIG